MALFIALLSPLLLSPAYAQRAGVRGGGGGARGGYYGGRGNFYGGRYWGGYGGYWGPNFYFGWGYPYYGYPYYWTYPYSPYWSYPYYGYPYYYGYNPYPYPPPPPTNQTPQGQNQNPPPQQQAPPDDPPAVSGQNTGPWEPAFGDLLSDPRVRQQLGIAASQASKIQQQDSDFAKTQIRDTAELQIKLMELDDLVLADKPDRAAIESKLREISAAQIALEKSDIDTFLSVQEALTPVQREKLRQLMTEGEQQQAK